MTTMTAADVNLLQSLNPATGEVVGEVPITPVNDIPDVINRARRALAAWRSLTLEQRRELLLPVGQKLVDRADELGLLLTNEMGKPLPDAIGELKYCGAGLDKKLAEIVNALQPQTLEDEKTRSILYRDPFGVCGAITPWNFPVGMPHSIVIPALMAGNTVVLKPSEETPLIGQAYVDLLNEHLPPDVLQIIHGADEQGKALVAGDVDMIAFTGSAAAGKNILGTASKDLKRVVLELGGKDPMIVLDDADIQAAASFAVRNSFRNAGQVCVSTERIYVDESIADQFEAEVAKQAADIKVGPGMDEGVFVGPMIHAQQKQIVIDQVNDAIQDGARVIYGGVGHHDNFFMPTVLTNLNHDMRIMREETFGPVACIVRFKTDDDAVKLANDTPFGLGAAVFGKDEQRASNVARQLEAGMTGINRSCGGASGAPWVGAKQSGYGFHSGPEGHRQFTQTRVVSVGK